LGMTSEKSRLLAEDAGDDEMATQDLLASYSVTPQITPARTPKTPASQDVILQVCFVKTILLMRASCMCFVGGAKFTCATECSDSFEGRGEYSTTRNKF